MDEEFSGTNGFQHPQQNVKTFCSKMPLLRTPQAHYYLCPLSPRNCLRQKMQTLRKEYNQILDFIKDSVFVSTNKVFLHLLHKPESYMHQNFMCKRQLDSYEIENKK